MLLLFVLEHKPALWYCNFKLQCAAVFIFKGDYGYGNST